MPLAEYLASEQAREDVRDGALELGRCRNLRRGIDFAWMRFDIVGMWRKVSIEQGQDADALVVTAYYRPDGDRYVVTDMGEGVRALRLRTGICMLTFPQVREVFERTPEMPGVHFGADSALYATEGDKASVTAAEVPDAICRVMLASLRVMEAAL